jgi:hypothetical protein
MKENKVTTKELLLNGCPALYDGKEVLKFFPFPSTSHDKISNLIVYLSSSDIYQAQWMSDVQLEREVKIISIVTSVDFSLANSTSKVGELTCNGQNLNINEMTFEENILLLI